MVQLILYFSGIVAAAVTSIVTIYAHIIPKLFPLCKTYSFMIAGTLAAAALGGYRIYLSTEVWRWPIAAFGAGIFAFLVYFISMLIIVNIRGA